MRYLLWQFHHMHTLHFDIINGVPTCPTCGATYQKRNQKPMSSNRDDVTPPSTNRDKPKVAKAPKSTLVLVALFFIALAFIMGVVASVLVLPYVAVFAILDGLAAVTFAILSLRETA